MVERTISNKNAPLKSCVWRLLFLLSRGDIDNLISKGKYRLLSYVLSMCQVGSPNQKPSEVFIILEDQASLRFKELNRALYPSLFNFPKKLKL